MNSRKLFKAQRLAARHSGPVTRIVAARLLRKAGVRRISSEMIDELAPPETTAPAPRRVIKTTTESKTATTTTAKPARTPSRRGPKASK